MPKAGTNKTRQFTQNCFSLFSQLAFIMPSSMIEKEFSQLFLKSYLISKPGKFMIYIFPHTKASPFFPPLIVVSKPLRSLSVPKFLRKI